MSGSWPWRVAISAALLSAAPGVPAGGNIVDIDETKSDRMVVDIPDKAIALRSVIEPPLVNDGEVAAAFTRLAELVESESYDAADGAAKALVRAAIDAQGPGSPEVARALTNLAIVQYSLQQYDAASSNYQNAIEILEDVGDRLAIDLVNPLQGLAALQVRLGRPDLASATYRRAMHITHVNAGPYNEQQVGILEDLSNLFLVTGDLEQASAYQDSVLAISSRGIDSASIEMVPILMRRAAWLHEAGMIAEEQEICRKAIRIVERQLGTNHPALVEPLLRLGRTYLYLDTSGKSRFYIPKVEHGEIYLKRAANIAEDNPDADWKLYAEARLALGDYYLYEHFTPNARDQYRRAWEVLSEPEDAEQRLALRNEVLGEPSLLRTQPLPDVLDASTMSAADEEDPIRKGSVELRFTVTARGLAEDIEVVAADPAELTAMVEAVRSEVRQRIYRPRWADGDAVDAPGQTVSHEFWYRESDIDRAVQRAAQAAEVEN